ncbi:barstar family protein [Rhizobium sp. 2YAF20]|uniref:barstar family protein n=1 Tax=Rhizobium sp. 2YAF20 TaxID=3233027 RepID=UPI003F98D002
MGSMHRLHSMSNKQTLLERLADVLTFPAYFGFNWDALFDGLRDFSWINEQLVVLVHTNLPALSESELKIYVRLLRDSVLDWRPGETHRFEVAFAQSDREAVERLLRD